MAFQRSQINDSGGHNKGGGRVGHGSDAYSGVCHTVVGYWSTSSSGFDVGDGVGGGCLEAFKNCNGSNSVDDCKFWFSGFGSSCCYSRGVGCFGVRVESIKRVDFLGKGDRSRQRPHRRCGHSYSGQATLVVSNGGFYHSSSCVRAGGRSR